MSRAVPVRRVGAVTYLAST